jgi:hypothetical protein
MVRNWIGWKSGNREKGMKWSKNWPAMWGDVMKLSCRAENWGSRWWMDVPNFFSNLPQYSNTSKTRTIIRYILNYFYFCF